MKEGRAVSCTSQVRSLMWELCKAELAGVCATKTNPFPFAVAGLEDIMSSGRSTTWVGEGVGLGGPQH